MVLVVLAVKNQQRRQFNVHSMGPFGGRRRERVRESSVLLVEAIIDEAHTERKREPFGSASHFSRFPSLFTSYSLTLLVSASIAAGAARAASSVAIIITFLSQKRREEE